MEKHELTYDDAEHFIKDLDTRLLCNEFINGRYLISFLDDEFLKFFHVFKSRDKQHPDDKYMLFIKFKYVKDSVYEVKMSDINLRSYLDRQYIIYRWCMWNDIKGSYQDIMDFIKKSSNLATVRKTLEA